MVSMLVQNTNHNDCSLLMALIWLVHWFRIQRITIVVYCISFTGTKAVYIIEKKRKITPATSTSFCEIEN